MNESLCSLSDNIPLNYTQRTTRRRRLYTCKKLKVFWIIALLSVFIASCLLLFYWELNTQKMNENDLNQKVQYSIDEIADEYQDLMKELNEINEKINEEQNKLNEKEKTIQSYQEQINHFNEESKKLILNTSYELQSKKDMEYQMMLEDLKYEEKRNKK